MFPNITGASSFGKFFKFFVLEFIKLRIMSQVNLQNLNFYIMFQKSEFVEFFEAKR